MKFGERIRKFFAPPAGSPVWMVILPYAVLGILTVMLLVGGVYGWDYSNSPKFCGTTCHTMPPENATYLRSPHANVTCEECHIGRAFVGDQLIRKSQAIKETYDMAFKLYKFPIYAQALRPARETCETCHQPETFSNDTLKVTAHFGDDRNNTPASIYLILKTGGGAKRQGLGRGIHWHIVNKVLYYPTDIEEQIIPYIRVYNDDGTTTEYVDIESGFDKSKVDESKLKQMDCITCHNRVSHNFQPPVVSVDAAMSHGLIDASIPNIHQRAVALLSATYASRNDAMAAIDKLEKDYKNSDYYSGHGDQIKSAMQSIRDIYDLTFFPDQKVVWTTHPNNVGHINSPGCFRCHDGKHLDANQQAIRLECNLCHSVPIVSGAQDFVTNIEISHGLEPESHLNANWISMHNQAIDSTCANCHTTDDPGGTSNTSFCSNSACHGTVFTYAGFNAPKLRDILKTQLPPPVLETPPASPTGAPTYDNYFGALFKTKCSACHGTNPTAGLTLITYTGAMAGGKDGPVINPGDSANSKIVEIQSKPHFANLSSDELNSLINWINAGAPEK